MISSRAEIDAGLADSLITLDQDGSGSLDFRVLGKVALCVVFVDLVLNLLEVSKECCARFHLADAGPVIGRSLAGHAAFMVKVLLLERLLDLLADIFLFAFEALELSLDAGTNVGVDQRLALGAGLCGLEVVRELVDDIGGELEEVSQRLQNEEAGYARISECYSGRPSGLSLAWTDQHP